MPGYWAQQLGQLQAWATLSAGGTEQTANTARSLKSTQSEGKRDSVFVWSLMDLTICACVFAMLELAQSDSINKNSIIVPSKTTSFLYCIKLLSRVLPQITHILCLVCAIGHSSDADGWHVLRLSGCPRHTAGLKERATVPSDGVSVQYTSGMIRHSTGQMRWKWREGDMRRSRHLH